MSHYLESVKEFHQTFNHPVENEIKEDNLELRKLRLSLLFEELVELSFAMNCTSHMQNLCSMFDGSDNYKYNYKYDKKYDKKETLDALVDIQYILSGTILSMGYKNIFDESFDMVHSSNMTKLCNSVQEGLDTIEYHKQKGETQKMSLENKGDKYIVIREDGKIMKSKYYKPVDLSKFFQNNSTNYMKVIKVENNKENKNNSISKPSASNLKKNEFPKLTEIKTIKGGTDAGINKISMSKPSAFNSKVVKLAEIKTIKVGINNENIKVSKISANNSVSMNSEPKVELPKMRTINVESNNLTDQTPSKPSK